MYALFNEYKEFIGFTPDDVEHPNLFKKKIPDEQSDIRFFHWEGDFDSGKMESNDIGYPIEEIELERQLFDYIENRYPISIQILNIIQQIKKIVDHNVDIQDYEFMDMADSIMNAVEKQKKRISYYTTYEKYIPNYNHQIRKS